MKLIYRGNYKDESELPITDLPEHAIKFKEPETPAKLNLIASLFTIPAILLIILCVFVSFLIHGNLSISLAPKSYFLSIILAFLTLLPHEFLHAICFGKDAVVYLFVSIKNMMAFVVSTEPISKKRFIFLSLLPNLVFGWIPLLIWSIFFPSNMFLFYFSIMCILFGIGDYLNVYNALIQMPKGSIQQLSGFHSYWYIPKED